MIAALPTAALSVRVRSGIEKMGGREAEWPGEKYGQLPYWALLE
jgi:hypothetical protein